MYKGFVIYKMGIYSTYMVAVIIKLVNIFKEFKIMPDLYYALSNVSITNIHM